MGHYHKTQRAELVEQARLQLGAICCPEDQAVVKITNSVATREVNDWLLHREFEGLPEGPEWMVRYVDLECATCGRTALMVEVVEGEA